MLAVAGRKGLAICGIYIRECFAYPMASLLWVLADAASALILPAVWLAAAGPSGTIAGYTSQGILAYYFVSVTLAQFITCHLMWDMAWDIKEGFFSASLVRPYHYFWLNTWRNLAWRVTKLLLFLPILILLIAAYGGWPGVPLYWGWEFFVSVFLAQFLSFLAAYSLAMVTLWTTEFFSIFRLYYLPEMFLSGRLLPLSALPPWAETIASVTHFRFMISFPVGVLLGTEPEPARGLLIQLGWCVFFALLCWILFRRGVRQYHGAGM